jgi:hypothetical protein
MYANHADHAIYRSLSSNQHLVNRRSITKLPKLWMETVDSNREIRTNNPSSICDLVISFLHLSILPYREGPSYDRDKFDIYVLILYVPFRFYDAAWYPPSVVTAGTKAVRDAT